MPLAKQQDFAKKQALTVLKFTLFMKDIFLTNSQQNTQTLEQMNMVALLKTDIVLQQTSLKKSKQSVDWTSLFLSDIQSPAKQKDSAKVLFQVKNSPKLEEI